jgi:hypothetical protein
VSLSSTGYYRTPDIGYDKKRGHGKPFHYFAYGACVAEVELDGTTGMRRVRRVDVLHDVGDILAPSNHAELGAMILKPYVSEQNYWMMDKHGIFQGYYFFHHLGLDRDMRDEFRGHPSFEYTAQFCHLYDQNSFDPAYESMPLSAFEPMIHRVTAQPKRSIYRRKDA